MYASTAKMIYPEKSVAEAILGKMRDANADAKFELFELPIGFQVVRITKLPDFMPLPLPLPVAKKAAVPFAPNPDVTEFAVYVKSETDKWLTLTNPVGPKGRALRLQGTPALDREARRHDAAAPADQDRHRQGDRRRRQVMSGQPSIAPVLLDAIEVLHLRYPELSAEKRDFALSLAAQFKTKGTLSEKQWYWVEKLADAIQCAGVPDFTGTLPHPGTMWRLDLDQGGS